jgi:hypothetical protein
MEITGLNQRTVSRRTVLNVLHRHGYRYRQTRKKGLLTPSDLKLRVQWAKKMVRRPDEFWCRDVAFYLDGVSFVFKTNPLGQARAPRSRVYRKPSEGLVCTSKGRKEGTGGRYAKMVVAISHGKGVIMCEPYEKMHGAYFANFIDTHFDNMFTTADKDTNLFVQDGDPSQNSALAKAAMTRTRAQLLSIPARSPDINPIENMFHLVSRKLRADAIEKRLLKETFGEFRDRVVSTIHAIPHQTIDNTVSSIRKRLLMIIESGGHRTKY